MRKKIYVAIAIAVMCTGVQAQYKKASFLNKAGRTYEIGFAPHFIGKGVGTMPGIFYSYGRDQGKHFFYSFDLELLIPTKFTYTTYDQRDPLTPVTVTGKSKLGLGYRYNFSYYLVDPENDELKVKPFVTAGINFLLVGGGGARSFEYSPESTDPHKIPASSNFSYGANLGVGGIYSISQKLGLKFTGGYNFQGQFNGDFNSDDYETFSAFPSHPYATIGIRFLMTED